MKRFLRLASVAFAPWLVACGRGPPMRPGTGALRVRVSGLDRGVAAEAWIAGTSVEDAAWHPQHAAVRGGEAVFTNLEPRGWVVTVSDARGGGGFFGTWGGRSFVEVRAGGVEEASVTVRRGRGVRGRVVDAATRAPIADVRVAPPPNVASTSWPVELPSMWTGTSADGAFVLGGDLGAGTAISFRRAGYVAQSRVVATGDTGAWEIAMQPAPASDAATTVR